MSVEVLSASLPAAGHHAFASGSQNDQDAFGQELDTALRLVQQIMTGLSACGGSSDVPPGKPAPAGSPGPGSSQPAAPNAAGPASPAAAAASASGSSTEVSSSDMQKLLAGDYFSSSVPPTNVTCPDNVSMDELMNADGGVLKKMGNQTLKGKGAEGISGGMKDNLAKLAGGKPGDIGTNKDVTMRALMIVQSSKNLPGSDGKPLSASIRHDGNLSGLNPSGEVDDGSDIANLQNWFKDPSSKLPDHRRTSDHMNKNDTEQSGAQMAWHKMELPLEIIGSVVGAILTPFGGEGLEAAADAGIAASSIADAANAGRTAGQVAASAGKAASGAGQAAGKTVSISGRDVSNTLGNVAKKQIEDQLKQSLNQGQPGQGNNSQPASPEASLG